MSIKRFMIVFKDDDLREFCEWCKNHTGGLMEEGAFITCMCGHFHSFPKAMKAVLKQMLSLGLVKKMNQTITIQ